MDYRKITDPTSPQYDYIYNQKVIKVHDDGTLRTDDDYIGVALGSYFGNIGNKFIFELDTRIQLKLVKIEVKDDSDTIQGFYHKDDSSVIEFVVDTSKMQDKVYDNGLIYGGSFNNCSDYEGSIVSIHQVIEE